MALTTINPGGLVPPSGYSHGTKGSGEILFVAGQIGCDGDGRVTTRDFVQQFAQALDNVLAVVRQAGGGPASIARLTLYVTDKAEYRRRMQEVGAAYRARMGRHFPAMALLEVKSLLEDAAMVEIEATALL